MNFYTKFTAFNSGQKESHRNLKKKIKKKRFYRELQNCCNFFFAIIIHSSIPHSFRAHKISAALLNYDLKKKTFLIRFYYFSSIHM